MGRWTEAGYDLELVRKAKILFNSAQEKIKKDNPEHPTFTFENFVESLDENDTLTRRVFECLIKETCQKQRRTCSQSQPTEATDSPNVHHRQRASGPRTDDSTNENGASDVPEDRSERRRAMGDIYRLEYVTPDYPRVIVISDRPSTSLNASNPPSSSDRTSRSNSRPADLPEFWDLLDLPPLPPRSPRVTSRTSPSGNVVPSGGQPRIPLPRPIIPGVVVPAVPGAQPAPFVPLVPVMRGSNHGNVPESTGSGPDESTNRRGFAPTERAGEAGEERSETTLRDARVREGERERRRQRDVNRGSERFRDREGRHNVIILN